MQQLKLNVLSHLQKKMQGCLNRPKQVIMILLFTCIFSGLSAQNLNITGKVTDSNGEAIPGATVAVKDKSIGTVTDANGIYSLSNVPSEGQLIISFIGYVRQEIAINNQTTINAVLAADVIGLDEVVVVGYGTMKKADLTGSVSTINSENMVKMAAPNITSTLTGKMTGVITRQESGRPGGDDPKFSIRGQSTYGNNDALVLVDGVEREFKRIDPNDIESITILKDAASAAIYGSRAANGVVLVTTKRGKEKDASINYTGSYTISAPTFLPKYMNAGQYAKYLNEARINTGGDSAFTAQEEAEYINGIRPGTNWWGEMMSDWAPMSQHNISASGGSKRTSYFISLGYIDQKGLYDAVNYERYNIRSNIDSKISDNLSVSMDIAARTDLTNNGTVDENKLYQTLSTAYPNVPAYIPDSLRTPGDKLGLNSNGAAGSPIGEAIYSGYKRDKNSFFETKLGLKYDFGFIQGLSAKFDFSYDKKFYNFKQFKKPYILNFYTYDGGLTLTTPSESLITLDQSSSEGTRQTIQTGFDYNRSFGRHNLSGVMIFEQTGYRWDKIKAYREGFISDAVDQLFAGADLNKDNGGEAREEARQGYIGRIAYNFDERYLLQANARYDGSYKFPKNSRWGFFPAFSAGWRISKEAFMENIGFISNLKIRGSWGQFGNDRIRIDDKDVDFPYLSGYNYSEGYVVGTTFMGGIKSSGLANSDITWEKATSSNIGFEFGFFDGKISGEFDAFKKRTEDILITKTASVPATFGAKLPAENLGIVDNWGYEGVLRYKNTFGKLFASIEGNITYATSKVVFRDEPADVPSTRKLTGQPFDPRIGYIAEGLFQSAEEIAKSPVQDNNKNKSLLSGDIKYRDINGDSIINDQDRIIFGQSATPKLIFGINIELEYSNIRLTTGFQGASSYDNYRFVESFEKEYNSYAVLEDSWRPGNEDARYPRLEIGRKENNSRYSSFWMYDGFYIKLRNIDLSYTLTNKPYLDRIGIESAVFSISGRNILTFAKEKDFDPENPNMNYPIMKTWTVGLNLTF